MKAWGACGGAIALCWFVACGTTTPAGSSAPHDAAAGDGGARGGGCEYELRDPCLVDCVATAERHDMQCDHGVWSCPAGSTQLASCPAGTCRLSNLACCPPGASLAVPMKCEDDGVALGCAPRSTFAKNPGDACADPNYCDVAAFADLLDKPCPTLGVQCTFQDECAFACFCDATNDGLVWGCNAQLCPTP